MTNGHLPAGSRQILELVRTRAVGMLPPRLAGATHLSMIDRPYAAGHVLRLVDRSIEVPEPSIVVFRDDMPGANFGHPCRYQFYSSRTGAFVREDEALFPPEVADPGVSLDHFHAPLKAVFERPSVFAPTDLGLVRDWPWLRADDNRFAILWTSQISNRRHIEDLELAYRVLVNRMGFPADHVSVLCYDGTIGATDASAGQMATWIGDNTAYQMQVTGSATKANLQQALTTVGGRLNRESLLFIHTNNHGAPTGLCVDNTSVLTPAEWATMLDGMPAFGTLVVTMEQCFSGAFLQPTLDHSRASRTSFASAVPADKPSAGASHFDPWAQLWFEAVNEATAYGAALPNAADLDANGRVSASEAFGYSDTYDTAVYDDPQYGEAPAGCGASIYLARSPSLLEIIRELLERYRAIERRFPRPPLPDPGPEWADELLPALTIAESLSARLDAIEARAPRRPVRVPIEVPVGAPR